MRLAKRFMWLTGLFGSVLAEADYRITVIEDEQVPLAAGGMKYFGATAGVMLLTALLLMIAVYLLLCYKYRERISELSDDNAVYRGWRLDRLKETVSEQEMKRVEDFSKIDEKFEPI